MKTNNYEIRPYLRRIGMEGCKMYQDEYKRWLAADLEDPDLKPELLKIADGAGESPRNG